MPTFTVSLPGLPAVVLDAASADEAFEEYKDRLGVIKTSQHPRIDLHTDQSEDAPPLPTTKGAGDSPPPPPVGVSTVQPATLPPADPPVIKTSQQPRTPRTKP